MVDRAIKKAGSSDFGGDGFREGLRRFLSSAETEANLTLLGRLMVQRYVTDKLANRLRLVDWRKRHPEIQEEQIVAPLFIVGRPRTGTTILHALLEQDPVNRSPLFWEVQFPVPPATPERWRHDPRIAEDQKILDQLFKLVPDFDAMHPMGATMPQDMRPAYEFHKRFLQHAQSGGVRGGRWVLKSPAHLHLIDALLDVFPDARIVHTHRDPIKVCASVASLTATLRGASTDTIDLHAIGRQQVDWWAKLIDEVEAKMVGFMKNNARDKHGSHTYAPEDFGIDPERDRDQFRNYIDYFELSEP